MPRKFTVWDWALVALGVALAVGMALTLWAGATGRVRSVHGVQGARGSPGEGVLLATRGGHVHALVSTAPQPEAFGVAELG